MDAPGAFLRIWWGEVNDDSDGPLEWCRPVPAEQAEQLAIQKAPSTCFQGGQRTAALVQLGQWPHAEAAQWPLITQSLLDWSQEHKVHPRPLGARMPFLAGLRPMPQRRE